MKVFLVCFDEIPRIVFEYEVDALDFLEEKKNEPRKEGSRPSYWRKYELDFR